VTVRRKKARSTKRARRTGGKSKAPARKARTRQAARLRAKKAAHRKVVRSSKKKRAASASSRSSQRPRARLGESWGRGLGPEAGGQSGDTEQISRGEIADSESVEELLEEGQAFEAGIVNGVENAPDADEGEVRTREVPEDDVPQEYLDED